MTVITRSLAAAFECLSKEHPGESAHFNVDHGAIISGADANGQQLFNIMSEQRGHSAASQAGTYQCFGEFARKHGCNVDVSGSVMTITAPKI